MRHNSCERVRLPFIFLVRKRLESNLCHAQCSDMSWHLYSESYAFSIRGLLLFCASKLMIVHLFALSQLIFFHSRPDANIRFIWNFDNMLSTPHTHFSHGLSYLPVFELFVVKFSRCPYALYNLAQYSSQINFRFVVRSLFSSGNVIFFCFHCSTMWH